MQTVDYAGFLKIIFHVNAYCVLNLGGFFYFLKQLLQGSFLVSNLYVPYGTF